MTAPGLMAKRYVSNGMVAQPGGAGRLTTMPGRPSDSYRDVAAAAAN